MDQRYPSNSYKDREAKAQKEKKVDKVVKSGVSVKKKTFKEKLSETFIVSDVKSVGESVIYDVLIPAAKKTIWDAVQNTFGMMLFGDKKPPMIDRDRGRSVIRTDYRSISNDPYRSATPVMLRSRRIVEPLVFDSRSDAEEVLRNMYDLINEFHVASVKDLYSFAGMRTDYTKEKYGWFTLDGAEIVPVAEGGFMLSLPDPKVIE
jgi:hypothetical protein